MHNIDFIYSTAEKSWVTGVDMLKVILMNSVATLCCDYEKFTQKLDPCYSLYYQDQINFYN